MAVFYHVDRTGARLQAGQVLELQHGPGSQMQAYPTDTARHYSQVFPAGVSQHGFEYALNNQRGSPTSDTSGTIELLCELVRRSAFPTKLSRFQSVFACQTVADAQRFAEQSLLKDENGMPLQATVWEVTTPTPPGHRGDMRLLSLGSNWLVAWTLMHRYWQGESSDEPLWELLLSPPVSVLRRAADRRLS